MAGPQDLKLDKLLSPLTIHLASGQVIKAAVWVSRESDRHHGRERVKDVLNLAEPMLPIIAVDNGSASVLNRRHVLYVSLEGPDYASETDQAADLSIHRTVMVRLSSGRGLKGELFITMPPGKDRTLDFLNRGDAFFYLRTEDGLKLVHLEHVVSVDDLTT